MSINLLSESLRKYIYHQKWEELYPIQIAAIERITSSYDNYILASRTASGKTEAAFLPIISKIDFNSFGVQVIYISPLIALINDQFKRIEEICEINNIRITKWHGEANITQKEKLLKEPSGIVLITPESLESLFVNKSHIIKNIFSNLKYVVIDEVHSFLGTDRGIQLKSLLYRLQNNNTNSYSVIGLSATISDYKEAKRITGDELRTKVLLDKNKKKVHLNFKYFEGESSNLPSDMLYDLYLQTKDKKTLIFPNSRGNAELISVKLKKISAKYHGHNNYFSHHSAIDKKLREYVEYFAKNNKRQNFSISCTSTLELGIDLGEVDMVVQIDATYSVASLIQRLGRSGRKPNDPSYLLLYATNKWSLLQALACWLLYLDDTIELPTIINRPYNIFVHQLLSIVKSNSGISINRLTSQLISNFAFDQIEACDINVIVQHLVSMDILELIHDELIIGLDGEKITNHREFYSVFKTEPMFAVIAMGTKIGEMPLSPQITLKQNILLAAKIWKIIEIDYNTNKINVVPASDGNKPVYFGTYGEIHSIIREKMLSILCISDEYPYLDQNCLDVLKDLRDEFGHYRINMYKNERPWLIIGDKVLVYTFAGTRINRTIHFLLCTAEINHEYIEYDSSIKLMNARTDFSFSDLLNYYDRIDKYIESEINKNPSIIQTYKWAEYLPIQYQIEMIKQRFYDFEGTRNYINETSFIPILTI